MLYARIKKSDVNKFKSRLRKVAKPIDMDQYQKALDQHNKGDNRIITDKPIFLVDNVNYDPRMSGTTFYITCTNSVLTDNELKELNDHSIKGLAVNISPYSEEIAKLIIKYFLANYQYNEDLQSMIIEADDEYDWDINGYNNFTEIPFDELIKLNTKKINEIIADYFTDYKEFSESYNVEVSNM